MTLKTILALLARFTVAQAITVYGQNGVVTASGSTPSGTASLSTSATSAAFTPAAFNTIVLQPPAIPTGVPMQFQVPLKNTASDVNGLSIAQSGAFFGFSIEMSVINQVIGVNASFINVPFLNLIALITERAGRINIRVGGNTQETAVLVNSLPGGVAIAKDKGVTSNPTETPALLFTPEIIYMLANVSSLVNAKWYLGIPMNDTSNLRLQIAEVAEAVLGQNLLGLQLGNEPDLYVSHQHRPSDYDQNSYFAEFGTVVTAIGNDGNIPTRNNLIAPSVSGNWSPESVWNTGFISAYTTALGALAVEHYPDNNCAAAFPDAGLGTPVDPQSVFADYLTHQSGIGIVAPYLNSTAVAQAAGKPFLMFETNTASCGGFPGVSDSFGSALWALDYGLQMAYSNFSGALLHVGGSSDTYNPFTPPPTNMSSTHGWTVGPIFYSAVIMPEVLGTTNTSRVLDLQMNAGNANTPGYAIYESGSLARLALFNYITDPSGASTYTATISVGGGNTGEPNGVPSQVTVKYLLAPSVSEKSNVTWAGQTLGGMFQVDGRFQGSVSTTTINCDQTANTCQIQVPAPGFALVFLTSTALQEVSPQTPLTFATTAHTKTQNTATIDASALATSNGDGGSNRQILGSTSKGSTNASRMSAIAPSIAGIISLLAGICTLVGLMKRV